MDGWTFLELSSMCYLSFQNVSLLDSLYSKVMSYLLTLTYWYCWFLFLDDYLILWFSRFTSHRKNIKLKMLNFYHTWVVSFFVKICPKFKIRKMCFSQSCADINSKGMFNRASACQSIGIFKSAHSVEHASGVQYISIVGMLVWSEFTSNFCFLYVY